MSLRIIRTAVAAERESALHEARLLLLLRHASSRTEPSIAGITKLAKQDFLLRYPKYFARLLANTRSNPPKLAAEPHEFDTVESKMIRFRYGPWDPRYRGWIGILVGKGLATTYLKGRTVHVAITDKGKDVAAVLAAREEFSTLDARSRQVDRATAKFSGTKLKDLVYEAVPELQALAWGQEISV